MKEDSNHFLNRAGVIGLGQIGGGIAVSLQNRGFCPNVYDLNQNAAQKLGRNFKWMDTPKDVAEQSDVVMVCVVNAKQVYSVLNGPDGLLAGAHDSLMVCILSTMSLKDMQKINMSCCSAGIVCMDCGVTPGSQADKNGMIAMVGGESSDIAAALPVLNGWARDVVYCGKLGAGMVVKLARNIVSYGGWRIVKEAQHLTDAAAVKPEVLLTILESADPDGRMLLDRLRGNNEQGKVPPAVAEKILPLMKKDLSAACETAAQFGVELPTVRAALHAAEDTLDVKTPGETGCLWDKGIRTADAVYGSGMGEHLSAVSEKSLYGRATLEDIFGYLWNRPELSVHERRLLSMGAVAATGHADLIKAQALGALRTGEMTEIQLQEIVLHLAYYTGWGNGGAVARGVQEAVQEYYENR